MIEQGLDLEQSYSANQKNANISSRIRKDIEWTRGERANSSEQIWIAKDPLSLKYFRLRDDERFVLLHLDGIRSINEIRDLYNANFTPRRVSSAQVQQLVTQFFREGLLLTSGSNQSSTLHKKRTQLLKDRLRQKAMAWLFFRLPGIYADRIAGSIEVFVRPLLNPFFATLTAVLIALSTVWLLIHYESFSVDVLGFSRWTSVHGMVTLGCVIGICKTLHELGHAVACKRFGGECHEIGLMFMFGIPCLYCDTTDAWLIPDRWKRIVISSGGIATEMLLGAIAIWVWTFTQPGILHWISVDIILVCLAGSVLFNANPLLRYDGYYILADWVGIANLQSEAKKHWGRLKRRLFIGPQPMLAPERTISTQAMLVAYHLLASFYRIMLLIGLSWLVLFASRTAGYQALGWQFIGLGAGVLFILSITPKILTSAQKFQRDRYRPDWARNLLRTWGMKLALISFVALPLTYPFERRVSVIGELRPQTMTPVLSSVAGTLKSWKPYQSTVFSGDTLVELESSRTRLDALVAEGKWHRQKLVVDSFSRMHVDAPELSSKLPSAEALLKNLTTQKREANQLVEQLAVRTFNPGVWVEPTKMPSTRPDVKTLGGWDELPLKSTNSGSWIESGTLLGWIASTDRWTVKVLVPQSEIEWISEGQAAKVRLAAIPAIELDALVTEISMQPAKELSPRQSSWPGVINDGKRLATGSSGQPAESTPGTPPGINPLSVSYWVTLKISDVPALQSMNPNQVSLSLTNLIGTEATAIVDVGSESLLHRGWRWLASQLKL